MNRPAICMGVVAALACATMQGSGGTAALEGPSWTLAQVGGTAARTSARAAYIRFIPDSGRVEGSGSCNRMSGPYTRSDDKLTFGALASTRMACADNTLNAQEQAFMSALGDTRRFTITNDTLRLFDASSNVRAVLVK